MAFDAADLEILDDLITQKIDSEILVLRQDLGAQLNDLTDAIQSMMRDLEELKTETAALAAGIEQ